MAVVDINTGKIVGCKKGTYTWWHEKGHIEFSKTEKGVIYPYKNQSWLIRSFFFLLISNLIIFSNPIIYLLTGAIAILCFKVAMYYFVYEEIWCWNYAFKIKKRKDKLCR